MQGQLLTLSNLTFKMLSLRIQNNGIPAAGSTTNTTSTNTTICELDSGSVEVIEAENNQILLRDIERILPGCDQDFGQSILFLMKILRL